MTRVPMGASIADGKFGFPFGPDGRRALRRPSAASCPQGISAELIAEKWGISREDLDALRASAAQQRAARARPTRAASSTRSCRSRSTTDDGDETMTRDEGIRPTRRSRRWPRSSRRSSPKTAWSPPATRRRSPTAPPAVLIMSEEKANELGLTPAGPVPHLRARRRRPGHDAHRPDPGHRRRCSSRPA